MSIVDRGPGRLTVKLFNRRAAELEIKNRILTEAAQKRAKRVEELERVLATFSNRIAQLEQDNRRLVELEKHNCQLTEAAAKGALRAQQLEQELLAARTEIATIDHPRLEAERAFYRNRGDELEEHNRQLTEAATNYALRVQELERLLPEIESRLHNAQQLNESYVAKIELLEARLANSDPKLTDAENLTSKS